MIVSKNFDGLIGKWSFNIGYLSYADNMAGIGHTNFIDSNEDGSADGFFVTKTPSIVTGNGFTFNAQRTERVEGGGVSLKWKLTKDINPIDNNPRYFRMRFRYRSSHSILSPRYQNSGGVFTGWPNPPANTGTASLVDVILTMPNTVAGFLNDLGLYVYHASESTWFELSEFDIWETDSNGNMDESGLFYFEDKSFYNNKLENIDGIFVDNRFSENNKAISLTTTNPFESLTVSQSKPLLDKIEESGIFSFVAEINFVTESEFNSARNPLFGITNGVNDHSFYFGGYLQGVIFILSIPGAC
mgnify:CR=1 FL=1